MFRSPRQAPTYLSETASFKQYLDYYTQRAGLTENKLALFSRLNQSTLNKIANGRMQNVSVPMLVCICLALGLNEVEAVDLMILMILIQTKSSAAMQLRFSIKPKKPSKPRKIKILKEENKMLFEAHNEVNFYNCSARRMREILNRILTRDLISHEVRLDFNSILPVPDAKSSAEAWNSCSNARELKIFPKAITFVTDDGVPAPVIDALAAMFPDVDITYNWSELFTSGFCGAYKYHNGVRSFEEKHQFLRTRISVPAKLNYEGNIYELCFAPENTGLDRNDMTALAIHTLNSALKNTTYTGRLKAHELASAYEEAVKSVELMPDLGYYNPNPRSYSVLRRDR